MSAISPIWVCMPVPVTILAPAVGHEGAHKGGVLPVPERDFLVQDHIGILLHRDRLPGQRSLLDFQVKAFNEPHVAQARSCLPR